MSNEECAKIYEMLLETLKQYDLDWVAYQVDQQIHLGRTVEKEIETFKEARGFSNRDYIEGRAFDLKTSKGPLAKFPITIEYQPQEQLILLIEAIERVVVKTASMEEHIVNLFSDQVPAWEGVFFYEDKLNEPITIIEGERTIVKIPIEEDSETATNSPKQPTSVIHNKTKATYSDAYELEIWLRELRDQITNGANR